MMSRMGESVFSRDKNRDSFYGRDVKRHALAFWGALPCLSDEFRIAQSRMTKSHLKFALKLEWARLSACINEEDLCQWVAECIAGVRQVDDLPYQSGSVGQWLRWFNPLAWLSYVLTALDYQWQVIISWNQPPLMMDASQFGKGCLTERTQKILIAIPQLLLFGPIKTVLEIFINFPQLGRYWHRSEPFHELDKISELISATADIKKQKPPVLPQQDKPNVLVQLFGEPALSELTAVEYQKLMEFFAGHYGSLDIPTQYNLKRRTRNPSIIKVLSRRPSLLELQSRGGQLSSQDGSLSPNVVADDEEIHGHDVAISLA